MACAWPDLGTASRTSVQVPSRCGVQEVVVDQPAGPPAGIAVITHPHPLLGGSALHKAPHHLAKGAVQAGWLAVRPNFRGVGASSGVHDLGEGESADVTLLVQMLRCAHEGVPLALIGFSFGAYVQAKVADTLLQSSRPANGVLLVSTPFGEVEGTRHYPTPRLAKNVRLVHGSDDPVAPLSALFEYARPDKIPVVVLPGTGHLLDGYLPWLSHYVEGFLATIAAGKL